MAEPVGRGVGPTPELDSFAAGALDAARRAGSTQTVELVVAGVGARLHLCGEAMAEHCLAGLAPLLADTPAGDGFELWAFDSVASGVEPPPPPWQLSAYGPREVIDGLASDSLLLSYALVPGSLSLLDRRTREGLFWTRDAARQPHWERSQPLRNLLRWVAAERGAVLLHGALVADERAGALLTGPGGAGKSTTALACAGGGLRCLADDMCLVADGSPPRAHQLHGLAKADPTALAMLPALASLPVVGTTTDGKRMISLSELPSYRAAPDGVELRAIVVPRVAAADGPGERLRPLEALLACAPTSMLELSGGQGDELALLGSLLRQIPCYRLPVGPDPARNAARVRELIEVGA
jgi:hypothetical protein